eukprot:TRINITY_DN72108_c0_g1_i1.p2 TRINITY_DN72108_c0_g1~~TRINITY_DN72108_c0_g1_i1.p2  ORF type:complete len:135 (-),score=9.70 TRINITY_DN72108_c0_g1_i1:7-366(-)
MAFVGHRRALRCPNGTRFGIESGDSLDKRPFQPLKNNRIGRNPLSRNCLCVRRLSDSRLKFFGRGGACRVAMEFDSPSLFPEDRPLGKGQWNMATTRPREFSRRAVLYRDRGGRVQSAN